MYDMLPLKSCGSALSMILKFIIQKSSFGNWSEISVKPVIWNPNDEKLALFGYQAITWADINPHRCRQMMLLGKNELLTPFAP